MSIREKIDITFFKAYTVMIAFVYMFFGAMLLGPDQWTNIHADHLATALAPESVWGVSFIVTGILMCIGAWRSNGIKGVVANFALGLGALLSTMWTFFSYAAFRDGLIHDPKPVLFWLYVAGMTVLGAFMTPYFNSLPESIKGARDALEQAMRANIEQEKTGDDE